MRFIGRELELQALETDKEHSFFVLYGRRRIGKTALIHEFIKKKVSSLFFSDRRN